MADRLIPVLRRNLKAALKTRDLDNAESLLERLKREDPLSLESRGLELEYLLSRDRLDDAAALCDQLRQLFPGSARVHYLAGRLAYRRRDYEAAARAFHQAQELHPHWRARRWLGKSLSQLGRLEEAEATLLALLAEHPEVHLDLAWVYERREQPERAIKQVDAHLERCPDDDFAKAQRLRLKSRSLAPEDLIEEVQTLDDLGEDIPQDVLGTYVQRLLESGQGAAARSCVESRQERLDPRTALSVAWVCYRLKAYDLALGLFLRVVPQRLGDVKLLGALEAAAIRCHRVQEVIERYQPYLESEPRLYGRTRRLEKHVSAP